uniref:Uncharacterized protein n=1 Tax=Anguilla anguilla TaxID=7936 RepID=A0A0E9VZB5_ANGAN
MPCMYCASIHNHQLKCRIVAFTEPCLAVSCLLCPYWNSATYQEME